jgi:two-component system sensor histidine kinase and response regulator WspE
MMGLTSEAAVATRWLAPFSGGLLDLKRELTEVTAMLHRLEDSLFAFELGDEIALSVNALQARLERTRVALTEHIAGLETFALRQEVLTDRLYREVQATRMRPFGDLVEGFPRLVRDLARQLGKKVRLEVDGKATEVDRDVAALLDAPLNHLLRNAVDHGIEMPDERMQAGKPEAGRIRLSAFHRAGMLRVVVEDDGRGVDVTALRHKVAERGLTDAATAERLSQDEVLAFLFLPGFSTAVRVSDVSGRGVGLDVVQEAMKTVGGHIEVVNAPGRGLTFAFDLPLTLSVLQALVVEVGGEPYAIPLTRIERIAERARDQVRTVEGREYVALRVFRSGGTAPPRGESPLEEQLVGLVTARQVLGVAGEHPVPGKVPIVAIREGHRLFGLAVDRIVGEQFIVVRPLDPRLGKVKDVSAAALMVDGTPLLVLDVDDLGRSIDQILTGGRLAPLAGPAFSGPAKRKRVLVVDDSITVREIERQLLEAHGYAVDVAVDGVDGWNAVRTGHYDLVVTDVDMPRLDGVELVRRMRADRRYGTLPIMIVSYKDRDEDRLRGLDAGASYYLPKSSFQDDRFLTAVDELIGHAEAP